LTSAKISELLIGVCEQRIKGELYLVETVREHGSLGVPAPRGAMRAMPIGGRT
jgi:hypothetical protein